MCLGSLGFNFFPLGLFLKKPKGEKHYILVVLSDSYMVIGMSDYILVVSSRGYMVTNIVYVWPIKALVVCAGIVWWYMMISSVGMYRYHLVYIFNRLL